MNAPKPRARHLGVPFDGTPGPLNAITDVHGVEVGHITLISGRHDDPAGGPVVRTGATALHPAGKDASEGVAAGWFALNGNGEMTGTTFVDEIGLLFGPVVLTNTVSVGTAHQAMIAWACDRLDDPMERLARTTPVVAETWDGQLNDIFGFHLKAEHVVGALESARGGPVAEGSVGGGTGMTCYDVKAGIGTASRVVAIDPDEHRVGVLVQANYGRRPQLRIAGVPVGAEIPDPAPVLPATRRGDGSIVVLIATDAPLLPSQLRAVAKRASLGLGRNGSIAANTSGDLFLAFSTANRQRYGAPGPGRFDFVPTERIDPIFAATVEATEEAIVNAMVAADPMTGVGGAFYPSLPHDRLREVLRRYGRLASPPTRLHPSADAAPPEPDLRSCPRGDAPRVRRIRKGRTTMSDERHDQASGPDDGSRSTGPSGATDASGQSADTSAGTSAGTSSKDGRTFTEEFQVSGERVVAKVKELVREGNVRRITLKNEEGKTLIEIPLTLGVIGTVLLPVWAGIGAIAALVANLTISVEKVAKPAGSEASPDEAAARTAGSRSTDEAGRELPPG